MNHRRRPEGQQRSRRGFLRLAVGGGLALPGLLRAQVVPGSDSTRTTGPDSTHAPRRKPTSGEPALIRPPALRDGSTIAVVAPASGVSRAEALDAAATLRNLGFAVKLSDDLQQGFGYLAAADDVRAAEFMKFVRDPEVDCIMSVRGGYGVMRILPLLDFDVIRANPKVIVGYSDITALINPIFQFSHMIAFHGPMATSSFDQYTLDAFRRTVMQPQAAGTFVPSDEFTGQSFSDGAASTIVGGSAKGRLVGGNLTLVTALMGTPWEIDTTGRILFIEEVDEHPYRVDRMLTQLAIAGKLQACAGVALGRFTKCDFYAGDQYRMQLSIEQVVRDNLEPLGIPVVYGLSIGHITRKLTVPIGGLATLDADAKTITLEEPAVSAPRAVDTTDG